MVLSNWQHPSRIETCRAEPTVTTTFSLFSNLLVCTYTYLLDYVNLHLVLLASIDEHGYFFHQVTRERKSNTLNLQIKFLTEGRGS